MQKDFIIPEENIASLKKRINKLSERAVKHGVVFPQIQFGISLKEKRRDKNNCEYLATFQKIALIWQDQTINGWKIVATLQHLPEGNVVRNISNQDLPKNYRNAEPTCDHCKVNRKRIDTYVLRHQDNTYRQVGGSCMQEFLGVPPVQLLRRAELLSNVMDSVQAAETLPALGQSPSLWPLEVFLTFVIETIKSNGWVSKAEARDKQIPSTAELAYKAMTTPVLEASSVNDFEQEKIEAASAIEWAENQSDDGNEYIHNIKTIALSGAVEYRTLGYAASIVTTYRKAIGGVVRDQNSEFVGVIGTRVTLPLTVESVKHVDTSFGELIINIMRDSKGNVLVWKTKEALDVGKTYNMSGRVKEHKEYHSLKQTIINYCKVLDN